MSATKVSNPVTRRLGEKLIAGGLLTSDQLDQALAEPGAATESLVSVLVRLSYLDEDQLMRFLSQAYSIPCVRLGRRTIDPDVLRLVPDALAKAYDLLPIERSGSTLTLAMADPTNVFAVDTVAFMTDL